ncbi:MAG: hypothetical protein ABL928_12750 [Sphingorhabdus sp.]
MPKRNLIQSILIIGFIALGSCSANFPMEPNCEKRLSTSLASTQPMWEYAHTQLLFDFSNADTQKASDIMKNGYAGSGPPGSVIAMGSNKIIDSDSKTGAPVITENRNEILVDGPSGAAKDVISKACTLESKDVWIKSVRYSPRKPTDAELGKIAQ